MLKKEQKFLAEKKQKPILMDYETFKELIAALNPGENLQPFFEQYYLFLYDDVDNRQWLIQPIYTHACLNALRDAWRYWQLTNWTLEQLNKFFPDEMYYCGNTLLKLDEANKIIGDDMIMTPRELLASLKK